MTQKNSFFAFLLLLIATGMALAQPAQNVSKAKHPNLAAAQRMSLNAFQKVSAAQQANEWDTQGHAKKAKDLLDEVNKELKLSAEAANKK